jgi:hypothetical protein
VPERFRVVYASPGEGGHATWLLSLDQSGALWDGGFHVSEIGMRTVLSARRPADPPLTIRIRVADEAATPVAVVSTRLAWVRRIAEESMPQTHRLLIYLYTSVAEGSVAPERRDGEQRGRQMPAPRPTSAAATTAPAEGDEAVETVKSVAAFQMMRVKEGRVLLQVPPPTERVEIALSINGEQWADRGEAKPGDVVHVGMPDALGAGAHWFDILEVRPDRVLVREHTWFYDIFPETCRLLSVSPYGAAPATFEPG